VNEVTMSNVDEPVTRLIGGIIADNMSDTTSNIAVVTAEALA